MARVFLYVPFLLSGLYAMDFNDVYYNETASLLEELQIRKYYPDYRAISPPVTCETLAPDLKICDRPKDCEGDFWCYIAGNGHACLKMGHIVDQEKLPFAWVRCRNTKNLGHDCIGWWEHWHYWYEKVPCVKYTGHFFSHTLLYSVFLGIFGVDRFCLGYHIHAIIKCITLGGFGVWWIIDIILIITYRLMPADGSNWNIYV